MEDAFPGSELQMYMMQDTGKYMMRDIFPSENQGAGAYVVEDNFMHKPSRKKFQEALRCLKLCCRNDRLPFTLRVHAAELIMCIYGIQLPENSPRIRKAVKDLVAENAFDRQVRQQVQQKALQDAEAQARAFLERVKEQSDQSNN